MSYCSLLCGYYRPLRETSASFVDEPVTGCERAVNGVRLSERFNLQENRSTGDPLKGRGLEENDVCVCPSCHTGERLENVLLYVLSIHNDDLSLVTLPHIDRQNADKFMLL